MPLPAEFLEQLKARNPIDEVMKSYVTLKRAGRNLNCLCPFHSEKTPSCVVYPDTESFYCFGCHAGGDVITFIMKIENLDYIEAVKLLASRAGLAMPEDGYDDRASRDRKRLIEMNREAARFYYKNLTADDGREGLTYLLQKRRLKPETIKSFGIGVAPNRWTSLKNHMLALGYSERELISASLLSEKNGRSFDFFVNRVVFPIFDLRGNVCAFSGRTLDPSASGGKYLNSRETALYKKSRTLFALNFAKNESVKSHRLILCEGNVDVVSLHQAGFKEAVATCGTAITGEHARLMSQYCDEVIICYDADEAGRKATKNAISILSAVGLKTRVVRLNGDGVKDVDDYLKIYGADHFRVLLNGSEGSTEYELANLKSSVDMSDDLGRVDYLRRAVELLAGIENRIEREVYISKIAAEQGVDKQIIKAEIESVWKKNRRREERKIKNEMTQPPKRDALNPEAADHPKESRAEEDILAYLLTNQDGAEEIFSKLSPDDFVTSFHRRVYEKMLLSRENGLDIGLSSLGGEFSADEMGRISRILARSREIPVNKQAVDDCTAILKDRSRSGGDEELDQEYLMRLRQKKL